MLLARRCTSMEVHQRRSRTCHSWRLSVVENDVDSLHLFQSLRLRIRQRLKGLKISIVVDRGIDQLWNILNDIPVLYDFSVLVDAEYVHNIAARLAWNTA